MNASQIHLALNHVPLFFSITGGLILLYGMLRKNQSIKVLSLYFLIAAALFTIPVYLTGEGAEELVEEIPGVSGGLIERHEEMAKIGLVIIIATGLAALAALLMKRKAAFLKYGFATCAVFSIISFGVLAQTSHLGGQIRHSEIQGVAFSGGENEINADTGHEEANNDREKEDDDKDDD